MTPLLALTLSAVVLGLGQGASELSSLTQDQVDEIILRSKSVLANARPAAVRLTFHDCVGGCDGCINVENPDNKGLEDLVADLEEVYQEQNFGEIISRADMWALLGIWSINQTIANNNADCALPDCEAVPDLQVTFQWGREDCSTAPYTTEDVSLPASTLGYEGLMDFFSEEFGFVPREVTALMGVHTLGQADIFNSGFHGTWVSNEQRYFNNKYYSNMADSSITWTSRQRSCESLSSVDSDLCNGLTTGWQWNAGGIGFNLNADMAIYKDFSVSEEGEPSCTFVSCPDSPTAGAVEEFASSNALWVEEFSLVYTKMQAHGTETLYDVV